MATNLGVIRDEMRSCIQECTDCLQVCRETTTYCIQQGGRHAEPKHLTVLMDCAEICQTSANSMLRNSDLHHVTCRACAEICEQCAEQCAATGEDEVMKRCAQACRRCAESCRRMSGAAA